MAEEPGQPIKLPDSTAAPQVPEQLPGISFALTPEGQIGVADSGLATLDDIVQIQGLRDVLLAHLNDLEAAAACSNAFAAIGRNASSYRKILESPLDRLSIDKLFAYGLILDNANASLKAQIKTGDLPEAGIEVGAALDSVIAIHGTTVMSTGRGWELLQRLGVLDRTRQENLAYREKAVAFAESIRSAKQTFTAEARDIVVLANAQIEQGRHPERSSAIARQTNFNLISLALKIGGAIALPVIGQAFAATDAGLMGIHHLTPVLDQLMGFFVKNNEIIRGLIAASGQELSWAGSALDWLGQVARRSDETAEIYTESKQQVLTVAEAETEAKRLILADEKVPDHIAPLVKSLGFGGELTCP